MSRPHSASSPQKPGDQQKNEARRAEIVALVRQRGFVTIGALAQQFGVTVQTIRRDINSLSDEGQVARYHGGAGLPSSVENIDYSMRRVMNLAEKERIARLVAAHVPAHSSLFINIGTTTEAVARALVDHEDLHVITNNLNVAHLLANKTSFRIVVTGGSVRNRDGGLVGQAACDTIGKFRVDIGIIGISGIDADGTLLDYDYDEVRAAQTILANARQVFLVTDHTKFSRRPLVRLGAITDVSALFTDQPPPPGIRALLATHGIAIHVATQ
ncbi:Glycerol-3-phosphate regulon repressor [Rhodoplanes serenus]|uniref:Glycerol-3-phosphate regulon repressor n=1 Tax=Rhodoplanes serenus TaxID=200615 RepID=A0A447D1N0_9BRAD|nr:DeoR family transcriptional regulator [Rhodoplanes serenus]VCU11440.1 Glycerol-3-phosphate regulon repressor [Rhodoplanes serenus]